MATYLYRRGNGNDGNYARFLVTLSDEDDLYNAIRALVANDYIAGRRVRQHIIANTNVDGEAEYGVHAVVHEGPDGEQDSGAAWLTAELDLIPDQDLEGYARLSNYPLREVLDYAALELYRKLRRQA